MTAIRLLPPVTIDDAAADLALAMAAHDFAAVHADTLDELEHAFLRELTCEKRLDALLSQRPDRGSGAWGASPSDGAGGCLGNGSPVPPRNRSAG